MATIKTAQHTQQGITTRYDLQEDHRTVKRTVIAHSDPQVKLGPDGHSVSSWKWTSDGWKGDLSRSNAGYEVAKAFGLI